jgi:alpha-beta hydrolase superfamily lysophospholipase
MTQPLEETFDGQGGLKIFLRSWRPAGKARAVVAICHGFNSHSGHYLWVADQLVAKGFAVYALDLRGRGKSEGERYYINKFQEYISDVDNMIDIAKAREPGLPVFLLGHSAGGVISSSYALDHGAKLAGLICESFAFRVYAPEFALSLLKGLAHLTPHLHVLRLPIKDFSRDPAVIAAMNADPFVKDEVQPTQTVAEMWRADERLDLEFSLITLPVLIIHGTADKVTKPEGSQKFFDHAGSADKTLKLYEGYVHDTLNDLGKETVMADIVDWLDKRLPA